MREIGAKVLSRVDPPAPSVTETYAGCRSARSPMVRSSVTMPASVFGGKNSNEKAGLGWTKTSGIFTAKLVMVPRMRGGARGRRRRGGNAPSGHGGAARGVGGGRPSRVADAAGVAPSGNAQGFA